MPREKFTFWRKFYISFESLSEQKRLEFITKLIQYALDDKEPFFKDKMSRALFENARPTIDNGKARANAGKNGGEASHGGGRPSEAKNKQKTSKKQAKNNPDTDTVTDTSSYIYSADGSEECPSSGALRHLPPRGKAEDGEPVRYEVEAFAPVWAALEAAGIQTADKEAEIAKYAARFGTDQTVEAIEKARQRGVNSWAYIRAILDNAAGAPARPVQQGRAGQFQSHSEPISPMMATAARRLLEQEQAEEAGE